MPAQKRLTLSRLKALPTPEHGQVDHFDSGEPGFAVRISSKGTRSFVVFYRVNGKQVRYTIGKADLQAKDGEPGSIGWARGKAHKIRTLASHGIDQKDRDKTEKHERTRSAARTYAATVEQFIELYAKAKKKNRTWAHQRATLLRVGAKWHVRPVAEISRQDIQAVLDAFMIADKGYMANRSYAALRTFFKWCLSRDYIEHHPMEKIERPFDGERPRERHYSDDEIKALWEAADKIAARHRERASERGKAARLDLTGECRGAFLKLLLLTGVRRGELAGMRWSEIDDDGVWTVPPERVKASRHGRPRSHVVPLPKLARRILDGLPRIEGEDLVFPGKSRGKPFGGWWLFQKTVSEVSGIEGFSFHAIRHTVRTGLSALGYQPHIKNAVLGHIEPGIGARYDHHEYLSEKHEALETWADHVAAIVWGSQNVEPLHG